MSSYFTLSLGSDRQEIHYPVLRPAMSVVQTTANEIPSNPYEEVGILIKFLLIALLSATTTCCMPSKSQKCFFLAYNTGIVLKGRITLKNAQVSLSAVIAKFYVHLAKSRPFSTETGLTISPHLPPNLTKYGNMGRLGNTQHIVEQKKFKKI